MKTKFRIYLWGSDHLVAVVSALNRGEAAKEFWRLHGKTFEDSFPKGDFRVG